jgi:hypothetical protein
MADFDAVGGSHPTASQCPFMARTYRQSHLLNMSGVPPTPDLRARMSGFRVIRAGLPSGSDVPIGTGGRGVMTLPGHSGRPI